MLILKSILANAVAPADRERFDNLAQQIEARLTPEGALEILLAAQIVRANWHLLRCDAADEAQFSETAQSASDKARSRADLSARRNVAELRRLQTDRHLQAELGLKLPGLVSVREVLKFAPHLLKESASPKSQDRQHPAPVPANAQAAAQIEAKIAALLTR